MTSRTISEIRLVNGSTGDPALFIDYPGRDNAYLFDAGDNSSLDMERLGDLGTVFITHHHVDHFMGLDRIVRANLDRDKTLAIYGPEGTIRKVYDRVKSYEYPYFPFQKIVLEVHELLPSIRRTARLECSLKFPEPEVVESSWDNRVVCDAGGFTIEAAFADHTVPCLAFALVEHAGIHPNPQALANSPLRPGLWVEHVLDQLRQDADPATLLTIGDGSFRLDALRKRYFIESPGSRIAYVTDTAWNERSQPGLLSLAHRANRLYCDCFYADAQATQAEKYLHMTASQTAEFARRAEVDELVLIHFATRYRGHYHELVDEVRATFPRVTAEFEGAENRSRNEQRSSRERED